MAKLTETAFSGVKRRAANVHNLMRTLTTTDDAEPDAMLELVRQARYRLNGLEEHIRKAGKVNECCGHCGRVECAIGESCPVCGDVAECSQLTPTS